MDHAERRRDVADAFITVAADLGMQRASMRAISRRSGVSLPMFAYYFDGKADLLACAADRVCEHLVSRIDRPLGR